MEELEFGIHRGRPIAVMLLKDPEYLLWMLRQPRPSEAMELAIKEVRRLVRVFDDVPFKEKCSRFECKRRATRCSVYGGSLQLRFWCAQCDPYSAGASRGNLTILATYPDAITHVCQQGFRGKKRMQELIWTLALAKGLPDRARANEIEAFFGAAIHVG